MVNFSVHRFFVRSFPHFLVLPAVIIGIATMLSGCKQAVKDPNDPKFIVAEKGTWKITREDLNKEVTVFLNQHQMTADKVGPSKMPIIETVTLKNMVLKKLLLDKAAATPVKDADKLEAAELDSIKTRIPPGKSLDEMLKTAGLTMDDLKQQIHEKVQVENVLKTEAFKNVDPTEQQVNDIYMKNKESFDIPAKVRASRILVHLDDKMSVADKAAKKKLIDKAHDRVVKGEDFGKVATEVSEDRSSAPKGGDLGSFQKGENADDGFDAVAFNTKEGEVSKVFETPLGYQFIKVTEIHPAGVVPIADARGFITSRLREHNMEEQSQIYAKNLLADSGVIYHLTLVDPPAQMSPGAGGPGGPDGAPPSGPDGAPPAGAGPDGGAPAGPDNAPSTSGVMDNGAPPAAPDSSTPPATAPAPPAPAAPSTPSK